LWDCPFEVNYQTNFAGEEGSQEKKKGDMEEVKT